MTVVSEVSFGGTACRRIDAAATEVFALITDVARLPEWNDVIPRVVERPAEMTPGAEWVVVIDPPKLPSWKSRSTVVEIDSANHRFAHRTTSEDTNPSYVNWVWRVDDCDDDSCEVTVTWDVHPLTRFRKWFGPKVRRPQLEREVPRSLARLAAVVSATTSY